MNEHLILIFGDDDLIVYQMNLCQSLQILKRDNDHVQTVGMCQVHESGERLFIIGDQKMVIVLHHQKMLIIQQHHLLLQKKLL